VKINNPSKKYTFLRKRVQFSAPLTQEHIYTFVLLNWKLYNVTSWKGYSCIENVCYFRSWSHPV